jgi:hypothetical protein
MAASDLSVAVRRLTESRKIYEGLAADPKQAAFYPAREHAACLNNLVSPATKPALNSRDLLY